MNEKKEKTQTDRKIERKWNFPSLKKTVKAENYNEALNKVNRKEKI